MEVDLFGTTGPIRRRVSWLIKVRQKIHMSVSDTSHHPLDSGTDYIIIYPNERQIVRLRQKHLRKRDY